MKCRLTKSQATELLRAAGLLPLQSRDQFISAVDSRLVGIRRRLTDDDVGAAIIAVLGDTNIRVTTPMFCCDSAEGVQAMARKNYEIIETATGRVIENDDTVLRSGQTLRVPMMFRDGMSEMQRSVADHRMMLDAAQRFSLNDAAMHRPGQRFADADARAQVEEVYQDEKRKLMDAWREPVADATPTARGQREGDVCTVNGAAGHLRKVGNKFECVPDKRRQDAMPPRTMTMDEAQAIKDAAYAEMCRELDWRTRGE